MKNIEISVGQNFDVGTIYLEEEAVPFSQVTLPPGSFSIMGDADLSRQTLTAWNYMSHSTSGIIPGPFQHRGY